MEPGTFFHSSRFSRHRLLRNLTPSLAPKIKQRITPTPMHYWGFSLLPHVSYKQRQAPSSRSLDAKNYDYPN